MINEVYLTEACQNKDNYITRFWINLLCIAFTLFIIMFYLIITFNYVKTNISRRKILMYWYDYLLFSVATVIFLVLYFTEQIHYLITENKPNEKCYRCSDHIFLCYLTYSLGALVMIVSFNNIIFDLIKGFLISCTLSKVVNIRTQQLTEIIHKYKRININNTIDDSDHIKELITSFIIYAIIVALYIYIFSFVKGYRDIIALFYIVYKISCVTTFILLIIILFIVKYYKMKLLNINYYSNDIMIQRIFYSNSSKLVYFSDFLVYKAIIDSIGNLPMLLFISLERFKLIPSIISYLSMIFYIYYTPILFIYVDKLNKTKKSSIIKAMFCLKRINIRFGVKESVLMLLRDINFDYTINEENILNDLNVTIDDVNRYNEALLPAFIDNSYQIDYYILLKMLYLFFENNKSIYTEAQKNIDENGIGFEMVNKSKLMPKNNYRRTTQIFRISRNSKLNNASLTLSFKFPLETLMYTIEENKLKKVFLYENKEILRKYSDTNPEFKIESLFNNQLYQLYPFYQLTVNDILNSLDPANSKGLFNSLKESIEKDNNYIEFHTTDLFLFFEIYDNKFIPYDKLREFFINYQSYLFEVIQNLNYTYLPLIIGIYSITYLSYNKIVILYRHQLSFSSYLKFNKWIKYIITEKSEKKSVSQKYTDIIDIDEIEIKNNIRLGIDEYNEVSLIIQNDLSFIKRMPFKSYPKINLFIGNQILNQHPSEYEFESESNLNNRDDSKEFPSFFRDTLCFGDNSNYLNYPKKDFGSEICSLFEKEYEVKGNEGKFLIKIFFSNIFRETCLSNQKETNQNKHIKSENYCDL